MSVTKYAGPRNALRAPVPPGSVGTTSLTIACGFENRFGTWSFALKRVTLLEIDCDSEPFGSRKKFVGKLNPLPGPNGKPVWNRKVPVHSQPPMIASSIFPAPLPNFLPLPNGKSATQKPLTLC